MSLMDHLGSAVAAQFTQEAARTTGMSEGLAERMLPMAMAALMGGINRNASSPEGAEALASALDGHDGGLLDAMAQVGGDDVVADGQNILRHVLGSRQSQTEQALAQTAGVDQAQIGRLLAMAAPAVMASLSRTRRDQGLDAAGLAGLVARESASARSAAPNELGGLLSFIDQDGDGDFKDDLLEAAGRKILGGLFGRN